jgi:5-methyltetrahydropteroyltriglutamate--homocysteine methyltransferase
MKHSDERILTTHAGSLPRPASLTALYARRNRGETVDAREIETAGREALRWIVPQQARAGVDVGNNGEQQRESFFLYLQDRVTGFGGSCQRPSREDVDRYPAFKKRWIEDNANQAIVSTVATVPKAIGEVRYKNDAAIRAECTDLQDVLKDNPGAFVEPFMNAPSPGILASAIQNEFYDTELKYLEALGEALRVEYEAIVQSGFVLQVDAPDLALERHVTYKDKPLAAFIAFVENVVSVINRALRNVPRDRVRLHVCWGNSESPHDSDVPLADILPTIRQAEVGGFVLPFANGRHAHEFRCFEKCPLMDDQILVAGVIDTLTNVVEHPETVADRLQRVSAVIGDPSRVLAGTDCGFDTSAGRGRVAEDVVWAKLASLRDGARIASDRLFSREASRNLRAKR